LTFDERVVVHRASRSPASGPDAPPSGFGFRVSRVGLSFGFRVSEFQVSGSGFRVSGFGFRVLQHQVSVRHLRLQPAKLTLSHTLTITHSDMLSHTLIHSVES
jgi:hypothetical protein